MNRFKKEEKRKQEEARKGLSLEQIKALDIQDLKNEAIGRLAREIHTERFPEEYDFMYDSSWDASDRKKGINPMSDEYIAKAEKCRERQGVSPLSEAGMATSNDSMALCTTEATVEIEKLYTRIDEILFYKWDPLHLSDTNWSRDEYESYVPEVFRLVIDSKSHLPIAEYLTKIATETMSMTENKDHDIKVAQLMFSLKTDKPHHPNRTVIEID